MHQLSPSEFVFLVTLGCSGRSKNILHPRAKLAFCFVAVQCVSSINVT